MYEQRDVLIVPFPFTDLSTIKQRPVLVLSKDKYNSTCDDIITCGITSNVTDDDYSVLLEERNLEEGFLPKISRIKVDKLFTIEKSRVIKKIAKINEKIFEEVKREFVRLI
ncbi:type II toxin-antitoxin system PemK/MazF family toxin [Candidatus Woesearchaeota archaeon]|nr:type II toxin-antitoxin system PemK/MazF family toxin [Candidatus Woesearchaeota archaeon]